MPPPQIVDTSNFILSPMPGVIRSINVEVGDILAPGQEVSEHHCLWSEHYILKARNRLCFALHPKACVIEAMKMQNVIQSVKAAKVDAILVNVGDNVSGDDVLMELSEVEA